MSEEKPSTISINDALKQQGDADNEAGLSNEAVAEDEDEAVLPSAKELWAKLQEAEEAAAKNRALYLEAKAETDNTRRRSRIEIEKVNKFAGEKFIKEILPIIDNLERALAAIDSEDANAKTMAEGIELTLKVAGQCLEKLQVKQLDPFGEPFDPACHEAVSVVENPEAEPGTVLEVIQKGYMLHDRVVRSAMVVIVKASSQKVDQKI